ncbi:hypothetical protein, partial [Pseudomonas viridiflava]|uniref:hypothetical protein n=1 Tax=Pseudomonas viridiflava TaxID=33069 RepID=UPI001CA8EDC6
TPETGVLPDVAVDRRPGSVQIVFALQRKRRNPWKSKWSIHVGVEKEDNASHLPGSDVDAIDAHHSFITVQPSIGSLLK